MPNNYKNEQPDVYTIEDVEIFSTGSFLPSSGAPMEYTDDDIKKIVDGTNQFIADTGVRPANYIGHLDDTERREAPALGFLSNLRQKGDKVVADLVNVPKRLADAIRTGAYSNRSIELLEDFEEPTNGKSYDYVIQALAWISEMPAVKNLNDLVEVYKQGAGEYFFAQVPVKFQNFQEVQMEKTDAQVTPEVIPEQKVEDFQVTPEEKKEIVDEVVEAVVEAIVEPAPEPEAEVKPEEEMAEEEVKKEDEEEVLVDEKKEEEMANVSYKNYEEAMAEVNKLKADLAEANDKLAEEEEKAVMSAEDKKKSELSQMKDEAKAVAQKFSAADNFVLPLELASFVEDVLTPVKTPDKLDFSAGKVIDWKQKYDLLRSGMIDVFGKQAEHFKNAIISEMSADTESEKVEVVEEINGMPVNNEMMTAFHNWNKSRGENKFDIAKPADEAEAISKFVADGGK